MAPQPIQQEAPGTPPVPDADATAVAAARRRQRRQQQQTPVQPSQPSHYQPMPPAQQPSHYQSMPPAQQPSHYQQTPPGSWDDYQTRRAPVGLQNSGRPPPRPRERSREGRPRPVRQVVKQRQEEPIQYLEFDERDFLAGKIPILGGSTDVKLPPRPQLIDPHEPEWQQESTPEQRRDFDERAFLEGKVSLFGDEPKSRPPREKKKKERAPWERDNRPDDYTSEVESDYDEAAFLSGSIPILDSIPKARPRPPRDAVLHRAMSEPVPDREEEDESEKQRLFNEKAFLAGKIPLVKGGDVDPQVIEYYEKKSRGRRPRKAGATSEDETPAYQQDWDENAFLSGSVPVLRGSIDTSTLPPRRSQRKEKERAPWERDNRPDDYTSEVESDYDEAAFLSGSIPILDSIPKARPRPPREVVFNRAMSEPVLDREEEEDESEKQRLFNEKAFLAGKIPLVKGGDVDPQVIEYYEKKSRGRRPRKAGATSEDETPAHQQDWDENAFLSGSVPVLRGSIDTSTLPPRQPRKKPDRNRPEWEKGEILTDDEFDEDAFLRGRIPVLRQSVDRELPPRPDSDSRKKNYRERAPWERPTGNENTGDSQPDANFDENAFLGRRIVPVNGVDRDGTPSSDGSGEVPKRTFRILRRSSSRDQSPGGESTGSSTGWSPDEDNVDPDKGYNSYMYVGKKIPSKTFDRLKRCMDRKAMARQRSLEEDPIERLRQKASQPEGIEVDKAVETLKIDRHDPEKYLDLLKQSMEASGNEYPVKLEAEAETTDF